MAKIITKGGPFTGHIGPVGFIKGEGETKVATALAHFRRHPDKYDVIEDEQPEAEKPKRTRSRKPKPEKAPESPAEQPAEAAPVEDEKPEGDDHQE